MLLAAQVGIAGSTEIGDDVVFGGQVGVGGHLTIGRGADGGGAVGRHQLARRRRHGRRLSGHRQPRLAPGVGALQAPARAQKRIEALEARIAELVVERRVHPERSPSDWRSCSSALVTALTVVFVLGHGSAQTPADDPPERRGPVAAALRLPSGRRAHLSRRRVRRSCWDTNFGGELDVVDYGRGRADVRRQLPGDPRRRVSPLRSESGQLHPRADVHRCGRSGVEVAGVFHHVSRHLADRAKRAAVAGTWSAAASADVTRERRRRSMARVDVRGVVAKAHRRLRLGDRTRGVRSDVHARPAIGVIGAAMLRVSGSTARRIAATRRGFAAKPACVSTGGPAPMEFFLAVERRIDPYPARVRHRQLVQRRVPPAEPLARLAARLSDNGAMTFRIAHG